MAQRPESSDGSSIKERIESNFNLNNTVKQQIELNTLIKFNLSLKPVVCFKGGVTENFQQGIPFSFDDYPSLIGTSVGGLKYNKRGSSLSRFYWEMLVLN